MAKELDPFKGKTTLSEMANNWAEVYGEDLANDYGGFYDELYEKYGDKPIPLSEVKQAWRDAYGEDLNLQYDGFWETIGGKKHISYVDENGDILESYKKGGTFIDQYGDIIDDPNDEEYEMTFGKDSFAPSAFMANKLQSKLVKKPEIKTRKLGKTEKALEEAEKFEEPIKKVGK